LFFGSQVGGFIGFELEHNTRLEIDAGRGSAVR